MRRNGRPGRMRQHGCHLDARLWRTALRRTGSSSPASSTSTSQRGRAAARPSSACRMPCRHRPRRDAVGPAAGHRLRRRRSRGQAMTSCSRAFGHGCHVLTEKPMATSLADARADQRRGSQRAGRVHAVCQNRRFKRGHPAHPRRHRERRARRRQRASTATSSSARISAASARRCSTSCCSTWRSTPSTRRASSPARTPLAVYCHERNPAGSWYAHGVGRERDLRVHRRCRLHLSRHLERRGRQHQLGLGLAHRRPQGTLLWDGEDDFDRERRRRRRGLLPPARGRRGSRRARSTPDARPRERHRRFPRRDRDRPRARDRGSDNIKSLAMVFGAIESAATRTRVAIDVQEAA